MIYQDIQDTQGNRIAAGCFVKVWRNNKVSYRGWVVDWNEKYLTIRDTKQCAVHFARPSTVEVIEPTEIDKARRIGQEKTVAAVSKQSKSKKHQRTATPRK